VRINSHVVRRPPVQACCRFVKEEQLGVANDPEPDVEPALLAPREFLDLVVGLLAKPHEFDHFIDGTRRGIEASVSLENLANGEERLDRELLKHDADPRA